MHSKPANDLSMPATRAFPRQVTMPAIYARAVQRHCRETAGLAWSDSEEAPGVISLEEQLEQVRTLTAQDPSWGRRLGVFFDAAMHGHAGLAFASAPSMRVGMDTLARFGSIRTPVVTLRGFLTSRAFRLSIRPVADCSDIEGRELLECTLVSVVGMVRRAYGDPVAACLLLYSDYPSPPKTIALANHLGCLAGPMSGWTGIEVPVHLLKSAPLTADSQTFDFALDRLRAAESIHRDDCLLAAVRHTLEGSTTGVPTLHAVARTLAMSARTLERRLSERDSSYRAIVDAWRRDLALSLLTSTSIPLESIATRLGYSEPSNFSRSVRKWFGHSPAAVRAGRLTAGDPPPSGQLGGYAPDAYG